MKELNRKASMMSIKEKIREYSHNNILLEKIWIVLQWKKTLFNAARYSDIDYTQKLWINNCGHQADLVNPLTFNEKLWFLKLSNRDSLLTVCSDKHLVRSYVKQCGLEDILKKEYGCYEKAEEIDFEHLPSPCYIKCNHASGMNMIYDVNRPFNKKHFIWKFNYYLSENPYYLSREWNYKNIKPRLICEELLEMPDGISDIPEIQFFCFHGKAKFIMYNLGLADSHGHHKVATRWVFDERWNHIKVKTSMPTNDNIPECPSNYEEMLEIAERLSKPFPHVRVDLFNVEGRIIFNEMTFYSGGGFVKLDPEEWQYRLGEWIDCSNYTIAEDACKKHRLNKEKTLRIN